MDYRTTIELDSEEKQLVLASYELCTFYCIYAKFTNISKDYYNIKLSLVNYKGPIKFKISKVDKVEESNNFIHLKIHTSTTEGKSSIETNLSKGQYLICQRISSKKPDLSENLVSEYDFPHITSAYKTPYEFENEEADKYIAKIKNELKKDKTLMSASPKLCIVGNNKLI